MLTCIIMTYFITAVYLQAHCRLLLRWKERFSRLALTRPSPDQPTFAISTYPCPHHDLHLFRLYVVASLVLVWNSSSISSFFAPNRATFVKRAVIRLGTVLCIVLRLECYTWESWQECRGDRNPGCSLNSIWLTLHSNCGEFSSIVLIDWKYLFFY